MQTQAQMHTQTCQQMHLYTQGVVSVQAAEARERWREEQGALSFQMPEAKVRVVEPHSPDSRVQVHAGLNGGGEQPSQRLVSELMILAGQAIACMGQTSPLLLLCLHHNASALWLFNVTKGQDVINMNWR